MMRQFNIRLKVKTFLCYCCFLCPMVRDDDGAAAAQLFLTHKNLGFCGTTQWFAPGKRVSLLHIKDLYASKTAQK